MRGPFGGGLSLFSKLDSSLGTTIEASTAAALLAATCSGGDTQIGANIAELLVPEMGDTVDQNMMAALMSSSSLINAGASMEEVRAKTR